jgi:cell division protein FtsL
MNRRIAEARPRGWLSLCARVVGWLIVPLYVVGLCTTFLLERRAGLPNLDSVDDAAQFIGFGAFAVVGALLVAKRPTNVIGWIMAVVALLLMAFRAGGAYAAYVVATRGQPDALAVFGAWIGHWAWGFILALTVIYLPLLFPDGKLPSRRWLLVAVLGGIGTLALVVLSALTDTLSLDAGGDVRLRIENPIGIEGLGLVDDLPIFGVLNGLLLVGVVGAGVSVVVRFRRSREVERQQMKWFVYAAALILLAPVVNFLPEVVNGVWFALVLIATSTAIGIAVLRYRLYEIDLIINRTLVYGPLTVTLIVIYIGGVVSLQYALRALTGQESQLAVVASTLAIAALFNPLRRRVQGFVDRRFYRRKYDAAKTMARFSSKLRDETDLETLREDLIGVVRETMQPAHVSLWLRPDTVSKKNGVSG